MKVVYDASILDVLYNVENSLVFVLISLTPRFWWMTCKSLGDVHLCQVLLSLKDVWIVFSYMSQTGMGNSGSLR